MSWMVPSGHARRRTAGESGARRKARSEMPRPTISFAASRRFPLNDPAPVTDRRAVLMVIGSVGPLAEWMSSGSGLETRPGVQGQSGQQ